MLWEARARAPPTNPRAARRPKSLMPKLSRMTKAAMRRMRPRRRRVVMRAISASSANFSGKKRRWKNSVRILAERMAAPAATQARAMCRPRLLSSKKAGGNPEMDWNPVQRQRMKERFAMGQRRV